MNLAGPDTNAAMMSLWLILHMGLGPVSCWSLGLVDNASIWKKGKVGFLKKKNSG